MLIYLLRHGQTEYNAQKRYQGQRDIPLSPEGAAQLRRADFDPAVVYVSTLQRTSQTARILFPEAKLVPVDGLKEMCFGSFEGRNFIEMEKDPEYQAWVKANCESPCPDGERKTDFSDRICRQLLHIGQRLAGKRLRKGALAAVERPGDKDHSSPPHWQAHSAASIQSSAFCKNHPARSPVMPPNCFRLTAW